MKIFYDIKPINEFTYSLKIHGTNIDAIYKTIKKMLKSAYYDSETSSIFFSAEKVSTFKHYLLEHTDHKLEINKCIKMIDDLTKQMSYLKTINYGFYGFGINDILVVDNKFVFCSSQYLYSLSEDTFLFIEPINNPYFSNPEIIELTTLPFEVNYKCCYYSLGALVVFSLLNVYLLVGNELKSKEEIEDILNPFLNTKIYWFIKRCLDKKISKRMLLLI